MPTSQAENVIVPEEKIEEYKRIRNADYYYRDLEPRIDNDQFIGLRSVFDVEAVKQSLKNLFIINKGSIPGKPQIGNTLTLMVFELMDEYAESTVIDSIRAEVAIYEPRVVIEDLQINNYPELNRIVVDVTFSVVINDNKVIDHLYLPFSHNDRTYLSARSNITV